MSWLTTVLTRSDDNDDEDSNNAETSISCLVALAVPVDHQDNGIGLVAPTCVAMGSATDANLLKTTAEFFSRHTTDGKFTFVDHRSVSHFLF